jgi:hypothetical protein
LEIKESTVLPWNRAANQWSPAPKIIREVKEMNDAQRMALTTAVGGEMAQVIEETGLNLTKDLEESGVDFKEVDGAVEDVAEVVEAEVTETEPDTEEVKANSETVEAETETPAEEVKEEVEVDEVVAETDADDEVETPDEAPTEVKEVAEPELSYVTQDALVEAVKMMSDAFRNELRQAVDTLSQSVDAKIESVKEAQKEEVEEMTEEIKEQISETPAASLTDVLSSVIGSHLTQVKEKDADKMGSPAETQPENYEGQGPFFAQWSQ